MNHTWYVTFEIPSRGTAVRRRRSRSTQTFETETEAKNFARMKFDEGLIVTAGTIILICRDARSHQEAFCRGWKWNRDHPVARRREVRTYSQANRLGRYDRCSEGLSHA